MKLKPIHHHPIHVSHFHRWVSAYETNEETVDWLIQMIKDAIQIAEQTKEPQIVCQDNYNHVFLVHPSKHISLYRKINLYKVTE
jgi:hypothetical protein